MKVIGRLGTAACAAMLAGCVSSREPAPGAVPAVSSAATVQPAGGAGASTPQCNGAAAQGLVGSLATIDANEQAEALAGVETIRIIGPGQPVTQDFRPDRLNFETDSQNRIVAVRCG